MLGVLQALVQLEILKRELHLTVYGNNQQTYDFPSYQPAANAYSLFTPVKLDLQLNKI